MALCEICGERVATVYIKAQTGNQVTLRRLCHVCAEKVCKETFGIQDFSRFLQDIAGTESDTESGASSNIHCPICECNFQSVQKGGLFGCPHCYDAFREELPVLFSAIHGVARHIDKCLADDDTIEVKIAELKSRLTEAVMREEYETAAELRDRIYLLESRQKHD